METLARILVVEDEPTLRRLVAAYLRSAGYEVVEAADGPDGVARHADSGPIDLILMDLNLPGYSGVEACRRILRILPTQRILVCSAAILGQDEADLLGMGVDDHLTKPYHPDRLLSRVAEALEHVISASS